MLQSRSEHNDWTISVADWCAVTSFLEGEPFLHRIVHSAYQKIPTYFSRPRVTVGMVDAPAPVGGPCVALAIAIPCDEAEAVRCLDLFVQDWLRDALARSRGKLRVVVLPRTEAQPALDDGRIASVLQASGNGHAPRALLA